MNPCAHIQAAETPGRKLGSIYPFPEKMMPLPLGQIPPGRLEVLVENASEAIVGISPDGIVTDWNRGAEETLGHMAANAVGKLWVDFVPPEERDQEEAMLQLALMGESSRPKESRRLKADGSVIPVMVATFPQAGIKGKIQGATQMVFDVSALRSLDAQLERAQRAAAQGMLAAMVCHDVSNSLGVALGLAMLHREQQKNDPVVATQLDAVIRAITQAGGICDQFRSQAWGVRELEEIDLVAVVRENFNMLEGLAGCDLYLDAPVHPLPVKANRTLIGEVLVNLVLNARAAVGSGGQIIVRVRAEGRTGGVVHVLEVEDDGVGIPPDVRKDMSRALFTKKSRGRGMGLGLASVLMLSREMGGEFEFGGEPGHGARMRVVLPPADTAVLPNGR